MNKRNELRDRLSALKGQIAVKQAMREAMSAETIEEFLTKLGH